MTTPFQTCALQIRRYAYDTQVVVVGTICKLEHVRDRTIKSTPNKSGQLSLFFSLSLSPFSTVAPVLLLKYHQYIWEQKARAGIDTERKYFSDIPGVRVRYLLLLLCPEPTIVIC